MYSANKAPGEVAQTQGARRWLRYRQPGACADLLSLHSAEVLTAGVSARIIEVYATCPTWGVERVYQHLLAQVLPVRPVEVQRAVAQSDWRPDSRHR